MNEQLGEAMEQQTEESLEDQMAYVSIQEKPRPKMKWFYFVIYFQLFVGAFFCLGDAIRYITGMIYERENVTADMVYKVFPNLKPYGYVCGLVYLGMMVMAFVVRRQLARYRKQAYNRYLLYVLASNIIYVMTDIGIYFVVGLGNEVGNSISIYLLEIIITGVFIVLNYIYFNKRSHLFTN